MNPYRVPHRCPDSFEDELWEELDEALADSLRDPGWAAIQASWVAMDAEMFGLSELRAAAGALLAALTT